MQNKNQMLTTIKSGIMKIPLHFPFFFKKILAMRM
uniref:Uncharacterized protein n=1 Tax=Rhizophora mucronata TaxID=61149 RepID=A0A2P2NEV9_RHIMU